MKFERTLEVVARELGRLFFLFLIAGSLSLVVATSGEARLRVLLIAGSLFGLYALVNFVYVYGFGRGRANCATVEVVDEVIWQEIARSALLCVAAFFIAVYFTDYCGRGPFPLLGRLGLAATILYLPVAIGFRLGRVRRRGYARRRITRRGWLMACVISAAGGIVVAGGLSLVGEHHAGWFIVEVLVIALVTYVIYRAGLWSLF